MTIQTTRRRFVIGAMAGGSTLLATSAGTAETVSDGVTVRRFAQTTPFPVNAYIVEGPEGVVLIDGLLTVSASQELGKAIAATGKPLRAALLTHPHPDHYAGLANAVGNSGAPILSVAGVNDVVRRDDSAKDAQIGAMFGPEWPVTRVFPSDTVREGDSLDFGPGLRFSVMDIGPAESHHDSIFVLEGRQPRAFAGDLAYGLMHAYSADTHNQDWQKAIDRVVAELPEDMILMIGHGTPITTGFLGWQAIYLDKFEAAIRAADWSDPELATANVMESMKTFLPRDDLAFLAELSVRPNARILGLIQE
ncbi:MBL fold metallo-hydrolase [Paracoccus albus]|uniref:MBL fold metallo-hydrolase n=1 Tax=Paracoccus albus TaxID=3017784 RepID=UPI0022F04F91|nr:MBL fold metallo-hydrolase [Paracoccus albus]WBU59245.1 MBL fold metallo-hydrolase [Paracoccus albus]